MTTRETLTKAADLIEQAPKLAKGIYRVPEGDLDENGEWYPGVSQGPQCYCAVGAIREAENVITRNAPPVDEAVDQLARSLGLNEADSYEEVFRWNDDPDRTKAEVVAALRKAAEL